MAYNINKDIFNRIKLERGIYLLKKHGITYSGYTKEALFSKINDAVNGKIENKVLPIEVVNQFVIDEISHGKNRKLYISNMDYKSIQKNERY